VGPTAAPVLATALRSLGYRPHVEILGSRSGFRRRIGSVAGGWNVSAGEWIADYPSPAQFFQTFLACASYTSDDPARTTNAGGFCDPRLDRLTARAQRLQTTDPARAETLWARVDRRAVDAAAWTPWSATPRPSCCRRVPATSRSIRPAWLQLDQLWVR
jgi:ABC-type oligopeptide transport system substrate-binding subunit